jgi:hypothetical protein
MYLQLFTVHYSTVSIFKIRHCTICFSLLGHIISCVKFLGNYCAFRPIVIGVFVYMMFLMMSM